MKKSLVLSLSFLCATCCNFSSAMDSSASHEESCNPNFKYSIYREKSGSQIVVDVQKKTTDPQDLVPPSTNGEDLMQQLRQQGKTTFTPAEVWQLRQQENEIRAIMLHHMRTLIEQTSAEDKDIVVTLHYKFIDGKLVKVHKMNISSDQFEIVEIEKECETFQEIVDACRNTELVGDTTDRTHHE